MEGISEWHGMASPFGLPTCGDAPSAPLGAASAPRQNWPEVIPYAAGWIPADRLRPADVMPAHHSAVGHGNAAAGNEDLRILLISSGSGGED